MCQAPECFPPFPINVPDVKQAAESVKEILKEDNYKQLIREGDDPDYALDAWKSRNLEFFHFILVSKLTKLPDWVTDKFFVLKVA